MRSFLIFIVAILLANVSFSQAVIEEVIFPRYIQGVAAGGTLARVPFVCRVTIRGLLASKQYTYYNKFVADPSSTNTSNGEGNPIMVKTTGFKRVTSVSLSPTNANAGLFTTDASGNYTGWFACESIASTAFTPGNNVYFRIMLNNGSGGSTVAQRVTSQIPIKVINFGSAPTDGTGIYSTPVTGTTAKNFVFLYDNQAQPVTGTFIEDDGVDDANTVANGYADFYTNNVQAVDRAWGTIIPNNLTTGIQKITQYNLADGSEVGSKQTTDGRWPVSGGGRGSTINTTGTTIVLDGAIARLDAGKTDQTIAFNTLTAKTYGDADFSAGATAGSGEPVSYTSTNTSVATIVNGKIHITGAGNTDIKAEHAGDGFFNPAIVQIQQLTVNKAVVTIAANDDQILQGAALPTFTVSYSGFVNGENESVLTTPPAITTNATSSSGAGTYYIRPDNAAAANYTFNYVDGKLVISPAQQPQTISFGALPAVTYGAADFDPGATVNSPLVITYASSNTNVAAIVNGKIHIVGTGQTNITASQGGNAAFLPAADVIQPLTVNKAALTITAENKRRLVGQSNPTFTFTYSGFVNGETNAVLTSQPVGNTVANNSTGAGTYKITVSGAAAANYTISYVDGDLIIDPLASQTVTFAALPVKKYGDADSKLTATASSNLPVTFSSGNPAVAIIRNDSLIIIGAGTAVITATQAGNATYGSASVTQTLTVQKPRLIVQANNVTRNEGEPNPKLTIFYSGFVKNEDSTVLTSLPVATTIATAGSIPGTYAITVSGAVAANYTIAHMNGVLTVLPSQGASQDNVNAYISSPGQLRVNAYSVNGGKGVIQVFDLNGTRLVNLNVTLAKGYNTFQVPVGNVLPGIYNVRVSAADVLLKTKVILQ
ncbi:MAG TPA: MBG domain-containing protein [Niastella sp.]